MRRNSTQLFAHNPHPSPHRDCDDGGFGSEYHLCTFGSDCSDCGPRTGSSRGIPSRYPSSGRGRSTGYGSRRCSNTCRHRNDGDCDDGGFGSEYHLCTVPTAQFGSAQFFVHSSLSLQFGSD